MKAGAEAHFIAGQLFSLGIAAVAVIPRMPFDNTGDDSSSPISNSCTAAASNHIGGRLSHPFRQAMLFLIGVGVIRVVVCHLHLTPDSALLLATDTLLGTIHVVGQSFLCLTTAYILETMLTQYINIPGGEPGRSLMPYLGFILVLTAMGSIATTFFQFQNAWCLVNLAEAISCYPVLQTLKLYTSVTAASGGNNLNNNRSALFRGPILTQMLSVTELWYGLASVSCFLAEAFQKPNHDSDESREDGGTLYILFQAIRQHHETGVHDWTRLLMHSVFLNSIDELQHFSSASSSSSSGSSNNNGAFATTNSNNNNSAGVAANEGRGDEHDALVLRKRNREAGLIV